MNLLIHFGGGGLDTVRQAVRVSSIFRLWTWTDKTRRYALSDDDTERYLDAVPANQQIKYHDIARRIWPDAIVDKANQVLFYYNHINKQEKDDMIYPEMSDRDLAKLWPKIHKHMVALCAGGRNLMHQYPPLQQAFTDTTQDLKGAKNALAENFEKYIMPVLGTQAFPFKQFKKFFAENKMNVRVPAPPVLPPVQQQGAQRTASSSPDLETQIQQAAVNLDTDGLINFERQALVDYPEQADQIRSVFESIKSKRSAKSKPPKLDLAATLQRSKVTSTPYQSPKRLADNMIESGAAKRFKQDGIAEQNGSPSAGQHAQTPVATPTQVSQTHAQDDPEQGVEVAAQRIYDTFKKRPNKFAALDSYCAKELNPKQKLAADRAREMMEDDDLMML